MDYNGNWIRASLKIDGTYPDDPWNYLLTSLGYIPGAATATALSTNPLVRCPVLERNEKYAVYGLLVSRTAYWDSSALSWRGIYQKDASSYAGYVLTKMQPKSILFADTGHSRDGGSTIYPFSNLIPTDPTLKNIGAFWYKHNTTCNMAFVGGNVSSFGISQGAQAFYDHMKANGKVNGSNTLKNSIWPNLTGNGAKLTIEMK